tara:strand:- start:1031 stop:1195 length:165 start_codon:yes stop_codon:yes gene_type:complete
MFNFKNECMKNSNVNKDTVLTYRGVKYNPFNIRKKENNSSTSLSGVYRGVKYAL